MSRYDFKAKPRALLCLLALTAGSALPGPLLAQTTPASATAVPLREIPRSPAPITAAPWLRGQLPADAFLYLRIPSPWGLLGAPKGNLFDPALQSAPYAETVTALQSGLLALLMPQLPPPEKTLAELLLVRVQSPLELAALGPVGPAGLPGILLTATLDTADLAAVNQLLADLAASAPPMDLRKPLQPGATGLLVAAGMPVEVLFDPATRRLTLGFADPSSQPAPLEQRLAALQPVADHPMFALERDLDASGEGLFAWINPAPLLQVLESTGQAQEVAMLRMFGGTEARAIALGIGGSAGKQRIKLALDMPQVGFRNFLPAVQADLSLRTAGAPDTVLMLGLPDANDLRLLEGTLQALMPPQEFQAYQQGKTMVRETLGLSVEDLLDTFGDEALAVFDQAGTYLAIRLRKPDTFQQLMERLVAQFQLTHERRNLLGAEFHHLVVPAISGLEELAGTGDPLMQQLAAIPSHLYWIEQDGYLLLANTPQTLMDYRYHPDKVALGPWLQQQQGLDASGALLMATTRSAGVPRMLYDFNLLALSYLGDLLGRPVDLFALPSATELNLPDSGAYSFSLTSAPQRLSVELVYESNPVEVVFALGGLPTLATVGVAAGIAIPAYQDYLERAEQAADDYDDGDEDSAGEGPDLTPLQALQLEVSAFHESNGRFPKAGETAVLVAGLAAGTEMTLELEPDSGRIQAQFGDGDFLILIPATEAGQLLWECRGQMNPAHLPDGLCDR